MLLAELCMVHPRTLHYTNYIISLNFVSVSIAMLWYHCKPCPHLFTDFIYLSMGLDVVERTGSIMYYWLHRYDVPTEINKKTASPICDPRKYLLR